MTFFADFFNRKKVASLKMFKNSFFEFYFQHILSETTRGSMFGLWFFVGFDSVWLFFW